MKFRSKMNNTFVGRTAASFFVFEIHARRLFQYDTLCCLSEAYVALIRVQDKRLTCYSRATVLTIYQLAARVALRNKITFALVKALLLMLINEVWF